MRAFATTQRSRIPVFRGSEDQILGFVHIKDMLWVLLDRERRLEENLALPAFDLRRVLREVLIVPETKPASELLLELRTVMWAWLWWWTNSAASSALSPSKIFSSKSSARFTMSLMLSSSPLTLADGAVVFDAALNVRDLDAQYNISLPEDPRVCDGRWICAGSIGFIPTGGENFEYGTRFTVVEMDGRRVARVKIERIRPAAEARQKRRRLDQRQSAEVKGCVAMTAKSSSSAWKRGGLGLASLNFRGERAISYNDCCTLPALWLVLTLVFLMIHIVPGDPVEQMLGRRRSSRRNRRSCATLGLDQSLLTQYGHYLKQLAHGDLGQSIKFQAPVRRIIFERYPATLQLAFLALLFAPPSRFLPECRPPIAAEVAPIAPSALFTLLGLAIPNFALGPVLILLFSIESDFCRFRDAAGPRTTFLPAATLGAALAADSHPHGARLDARRTSSDYVRTARAKGLSHQRGACSATHFATR